MNEAFFRGYYEAYNSEDESRLADFLAEDVVLRSAQGEQRGRDAYLATYRQIISAFTDRMTPESITISQNKATVRITDRFVAKGNVAEFLGRSFKTGEEFMLTLVGNYEVRDGRIAVIDIKLADTE